MSLIIRLSGTRSLNKAIEKDLCSDLSNEQTKKVTDHFTAESRQLYTTNITYGEINMPKMYIELIDDNVIPFATQQKMIRHLNTINLKTIDSGHLPMMTRTGKLAIILNKFIVKIMVAGLMEQVKYGEKKIYAYET